MSHERCRPISCWTMQVFGGAAEPIEITFATSRDHIEIINCAKFCVEFRGIKVEFLM